MALCYAEANGLTAESSRTKYTTTEGEKSFPRAEGKIFTKYSFDSLLDGNDGREGDERKKSFLEIYLDNGFYISSSFLVHANLGLRPVVHRENYGDEGYLPRKHYFFRGYGVVAEEIDLEYKEERLLIGAGKFNPSFGQALKNKYYGICGTDMINSYQLYEKLGFYVAMTLPIMTARANFFRNDVTFLSHSLLSDRGAYDLKGDIGNVGNILENFSFTVNFPALDSYGINFGFRRLATNDPEKKSELGYVFGLEFIIEETRDKIGAAPALELVALHNYGGKPKSDVFYTSANLPFFYDRWNFGTSWSAKIFKDNGGTTRISQMVQVSIGYMFQNGVAVDFSRKYEEGYSSGSDGKSQRDKLSSWGVGLSYMLKFE
jgi:hypothetical protein